MAKKPDWWKVLETGLKIGQLAAGAGIIGGGGSTPNPDQANKGTGRDGGFGLGTYGAGRPSDPAKPVSAGLGFNSGGGGLNIGPASDQMLGQLVRQDIPEGMFQKGESLPFDKAMKIGGSVDSVSGTLGKDMIQKLNNLDATQVAQNFKKSPIAAATETAKKLTPAQEMVKFEEIMGKKPSLIQKTLMEKGFTSQELKDLMDKHSQQNWRK